MSKFDMDILQPLANSEILFFLDILKNHLPSALRAHHFLLMQYQRNIFLNRPENKDLSIGISARSKFNLFTHRNGERKHATIVAISLEGPKEHTDDYTIFVYSLQENNQELNECIRNTKRINWKLGPMFLSIEVQHMPIVRDVMTEQNLSISWELPNVCLWLPKEKALNFDYEIPDDVYIAELKPEDSQVIDNSWYIKSPGTANYIKSELTLNWGVGIFKKDTNQLVSWILLNESYACGTLTTLKTARGKGYGKLVTLAFCRQFAEREQMDLIAYIVHANSVSRKLFNGLGFTQFSDCFWSKIKRTET